jgi:hypothetical protein
VILHPGRGDDWWHGPHGLAYTANGNFYAAGKQIPLDGEPEVWATHRGWVVRSNASWYRIEGDEVHRSDRDRFGEEVTATRGRGWSIEGLPLPLGARHSPTLSPFPTGTGAAWSADGYIYRATDRIEVLCPGRDFSLGPLGAVRVGDRAAPPGRCTQPIPPLSASIRWRRDGTALCGHDGSDTVEIDLSSGEIRRRPGLLPVSYEAALHLDSGEIRCGDRVLQWGVIEASSALRGTRLAGPGAVIWDLQSGEPLFTDPRVQLGVTVAVPQGFATANWETGRGHLLSPDGEILSEIAVPLAEDDVLCAATVDGTLLSAEGRAWTLDGSEVTPRPSRAPVHSTVVDGRRFTWTDDGQLCVETTKDDA